jgi:hypothetical protein
MLVGVNHWSALTTFLALQYNVLKHRGDNELEGLSAKEETYILGPFLIHLINNNNAAKDSSIDMYNNDVGKRFMK